MSTTPASPSPLYLKLLGETARIEWAALERLFAQGKVLLVAPDADLVGVAEAIATDDESRITAWLASGIVLKMPADTALRFATQQPPIWAVVVSPWVCVQERS